MALNIDDYKVIAISSPYGVEKDLSYEIDKTSDSYNIICVSKTTAMKDNNINEAIFVLINPISQVSKDVIEQLGKSKKVILYLHNTDIDKYSDNINKIVTAVKSVLNREIKFSHEPIENEKFKPYKIFLECITTKSKTNAECFKKLIEDSLKKNNNPHLIALFILCQGYLAVHDKEFRDKLKKEAKDITIKDKSEFPDDWWAPAFGDEKNVINFDNTDVYKELSAIGKDVTAIQNLFNKRNTDNTDEKIKIVKSAYDFLTLPGVLKPVEINAK